MVLAAASVGFWVVLPLIPFGVRAVWRHEAPKEMTGWFVTYRSVWHFTDRYLDDMPTEELRRWHRQQFGGLQTNAGIVAVNLGLGGQETPFTGTYPFEDQRSCEAIAKRLNDRDAAFKAEMAKLGRSADLIDEVHTVSTVHSCARITATRTAGGYWDMKKELATQTGRP
jgi:hypothetical protein